VTLVRPKPRQCRWPCFAHHYWPTKVSRALSQRWMRPNRVFRPAALLLADHRSRDSTGQPSLGALKAFMLLAEAPAGSLTRCLLNLNCHNHNQHAGRPCFSLAFLIGGKRSNLARLSESRLSFHIGFSAALENLRWVQKISRTKPGASGGRFTSRRGSAAAFRKPNIAVSFD